MLRGTLEHTVRNLRDCHIVAANRIVAATQIIDKSAQNTPAASTVSLFDFWLSGEDAQLRVYSPDRGSQQSKGNPTWWLSSHFKPTRHPLTPNTFGNYTGTKVFLRPKGEYLVADARELPEDAGLSYSILYTQSKTIKGLPQFHIPLIELNRAWAESRKSTWFIINSLLDTELASWKVVGESTFRDSKALLVEIPRQDTMKANLPSYKDPIAVTPMWKVWFSTDPMQGYFPIKIETTTQYEFRGHKFQVERPPTSRAAVVFEAFDVVEFDEGIWFPRAGRQETAAPPASGDSFSYDLQPLIERYLREGKLVDNSNYPLASRVEWHIISLEKSEPTDSLWCDPPEGVCVINADTASRIISGLTEEESLKVFKSDEGQQTSGAEGLAGNASVKRWVLMAVNVILVALLLVRVISRGVSSKNKKGASQD